MLRNLGIVSFLLGVLVIIASVGLFFITAKDIEEERDKQNALIYINETAIKYEKQGLAALQSIAYPTQNDARQALSLSTDIQLQELEIQESNRALGNLVRKERQSRRYLYLGVGVGLFLCVLQTSFLMLLGRQPGS